MPRQEEVYAGNKSASWEEEEAHTFISNMYPLNQAREENSNMKDKGHNNQRKLT